MTATQRRILLALLIVVLGGLYWYGGMQQVRQVNTNIVRIDQSAYIQFARDLKSSGYTDLGGRNRMPLYPFLQSLFLEDGMTDGEFFFLGKVNNLALSILLLGAFALVVSTQLSPPGAFALAAVTAFEVHIFKAGYFQSEILFYFIDFILFLLFWKLLEKPSVGLGLVTGIIAGLAHLTKASILPGMVLFLLMLLLRGGVAAVRHLRAESEKVEAKRTALKHVWVGISVAVLFLLTVWPYIRQSKEIYGRYFYNVNSTFYFWTDSWVEAERRTKKHGDREGWPDLPPEEIPSPRNYFREHSLVWPLKRIVRGGRRVLLRIGRAYGYHWFVFLYAGLLAAAAGLRAKDLRGMIRRNWLLLAFLLAYFGGYAALYAWYGLIAAGNRLVLALFMPLMFSFAYGLEQMLALRQVRIAGRRVTLLRCAQLLILTLLAVDTYFVLTVRVGTIFGGS